MPTTGIVNGSLLRLYVGDVAVAYSTSDTLDLTRAMREIAHKDNTSAWVEVAPGQKSATFSTELLFADVGDTSANVKFNTLFDTWNNGGAITCTYTTDVVDDSIYTFSAYIESLSLNSSNQENVTASASLRINGAVTKITNAVLAAPTNLNGTAGVAGAITLTWTAPSAVGKPALTDYVVQYKLAGGDDTTYVTFSDGVSTTATTTITAGVLSLNASHTFRVAAVNGAGQGAYSSTINLTPIA
jgi:hypothetical protein